MAIKLLLKRKLALNEMTQKELAAQTGIRPPTISAMCQNSVKHIPIDVLDRICDALKCQPGDIVEHIPNSEPMIHNVPTAPPEETRSAAEETPKPKTFMEKPVPVKPFTPEAREAVDLKLLLTDIQYQLDIQVAYGIEVLSDLLNKARSMTEPKPQEV